MKCKKITNGKFINKGYEYGKYEIRNHGYYQPEQCIYWEAIDKNTGQADFHAKTKKHILKLIDNYLKNDYNIDHEQTTQKTY